MPWNGQRATAYHSDRPDHQTHEAPVSASHQAPPTNQTPPQALSADPYIEGDEEYKGVDELCDNNYYGDAGNDDVIYDDAGEVEDDYDDPECYAATSVTETVCLAYHETFSSNNKLYRHLLNCKPRASALDNGAIAYFAAPGDAIPDNLPVVESNRTADASPGDAYRT